MAEVLGIVSSVAIILSAVRTYGAIVKQVTAPSKVRYISMQAKLVAEEAKITQWMAYMNVEELHELRNMLEPEDQDRVMDLFRNLQDLLLEAKKRMDRLDLQKDKLANRLRWAIGGEYENLKQIMEAIREINGALYAIAQPPPRYTPAAAAVANWDADTRSLVAAPPAQEIEDSSIPGEEHSDLTPPRRVVSLLFYQAVIALRKISGRIVENKDLGRSLTKLRNWSGTFLEGDLALDVLLTQGGDKDGIHARLKDGLVTTFVDILLLEELLLKHLIETQNARDVNQVLSSLNTTFFDDEIIDVATQRTAPISKGVSGTELVAQSAKFLDRAIDDLYDLLPVIRTIRRSYVLEQERGTKETPITSEESIKVGDIIEDIDEMMKTLDSSTESVDDNVARVMNKERERLAEFRESFGATEMGKDTKEQLQAILEKMRVRKEWDSSKSSGNDDVKTEFRRVADISDPEKKRAHLRELVKSVQKGNDELQQLQRDTSYE